MQLRAYQLRAVDATVNGWRQWRRQLGVAATGAGKTVIFSKLAAMEKGRTLILAHREELVNQAADKLRAATGIYASVEQGAQQALPGHGVIVGSVQSVRRRLAKYAPDAFDLVICDEAHHALAAEWQTVLSHFSSARVLGVTATPDRVDRRSLGKYFENVAFEIGLLELISSGYLCGLRALCLDVQLDARHLQTKRGDIGADDAADLVSPQIAELARAIAAEIWDRKALIFLPRCDVSQAMAAALGRHGIDARHVDGASTDREARLSWFAGAGRGSALVNAMLLTEGYDQPDIDCVCVLRPTKSRALYAQMVGRGMRIADGKDFCLLLDPLWLSGEIDLCKPADLTGGNVQHRAALQKRMEEGLDLTAAEKIARADVEAALVAQLVEAAKNRKAPRGMVDPLAWAIGIHDSDIETYEPTMPWEELPANESQKRELGALGIWTDNLSRGLASKLIDRIAARRDAGLASPKQVMLLRQLGEPNAEIMTREQAGYVIRREIGRG